MGLDEVPADALPVTEKLSVTGRVYDAVPLKLVPPVGVILALNPLPLEEPNRLPEFYKVKGLAYT